MMRGVLVVVALSTVWCASVQADSGLLDEIQGVEGSGHILDKPLTSKHKFAYVIMHYEGTVHDDDYLLGLRVLIYSLKKSGTKHDIVALLSTNVRQRTADILEKDGCIIKRLPNIENPYKDDPSRRRKYDPRFVFVMNKLYIWNLLEYKRIVYMDTDNLVLHNPDSLFYCGKWCVLYFNTANFHTGLMVVEPSAEVYETMQRDMATLDSYDGGDQGFLTQFATAHKLDYNMPIFVETMRHEAVAKDEPVDDPFMVMPISLNLHQMYVYLNLGWGAWNHGEYKDLDPPGLTYAMTSPSYLKPWYWYPHLVLPDSHVYWLIFRLELEARDGVDPYDFWFSSLVMRCLVLFAILSAALYMAHLQRQKLILNPSSRNSVMKDRSTFNQRARGFAAYFFQLFITVCCVVWSIPMATALWIAFPTALLIAFVAGLNCACWLSIIVNNPRWDYKEMCIAQAKHVLFIVVLVAFWRPSMNWLTYHTAGKIFGGVGILYLIVVPVANYYGSRVLNVNVKLRNEE